jgi:hypothetical protein
MLSEHIEEVLKNHLDLKNTEKNSLDKVVDVVSEHIQLNEVDVSNDTITL